MKLCTLFIFTLLHLHITCIKSDNETLSLITETEDLKNPMFQTDMLSRNLFTHFMQPATLLLNVKGVTPMQQKKIIIIFVVKVLTQNAIDMVRMK